MRYKMDLHSDEYLRMLMRRQFALSAALAGVLVAALAAVPVMGLLLPETMGAPVMGFSLSWLILGFLIFPILIGLAYSFVRLSNAFEDEAIGMVDPSTLPPHRDAGAGPPAGVGD